MSVRKRVAVIGGGPCGMTACKTFLEEGFEPVCFERTGHIGGLWRYHEDDVDGLASVMKSTILNTSKEMGAFSDYPPPAEFPNYMHHTLMYEYINMYAENFDCLKYVRYHHETMKIEKAEDYEDTGCWKVTNRNTKTGDIVSELFDCVVVCVGYHVYPNVPTFPNQEEFEGKIMHTHSLKKANGFEDRRVVVVGVGNSGMDAAVELSSVTKQVYLSSRRGVWIFPRVGLKGYPNDVLFLRRFLRILMGILPYNWICSILEMYLNSRFDHSLYNLRPKHRALSHQRTVSDSMPIKLLSGVVVTRGAVKQFTKKGVIFENEQDETQIDVVVLATGYKIKFPFLSDDVVQVINNKFQLYKFIFPPHLPHATLGMLGLIQTTGPRLPVGEMQCRWTVLIMTQKLKLPSEAKMLAEIKAKDDQNRVRFVDSPRHTDKVDFINYQDELAAEIGVKPNWLKMAFTDPILWLAIFFGPALPYQYRLQGPHLWKDARKAILTYKERIVKPFLRPEQRELKQKENHLLHEMFHKLLLILLILCCFYFLYLV